MKLTVFSAALMLIGCATGIVASEDTSASRTARNPQATTMTLHFETTSEIGVSSYVLEKSVNGIWVTVIEMAPVGKPNKYDVAFPIGSGAYRLKTRKAQSVDYSKIINVK